MNVLLWRTVNNGFHCVCFGVIIVTLSSSHTLSHTLTLSLSLSLSRQCNSIYSKKSPFRIGRMLSFLQMVRHTHSHTHVVGAMSGRLILTHSVWCCARAVFKSLLMMIINPPAMNPRPLTALECTAECIVLPAGHYCYNDIPHTPFTPTLHVCITTLSLSLTHTHTYTHACAT